MNKIVKLLIPALIGTSLIALSGCKKTEEIGQKFIDNSKKTYDDAATKVNKVIDDTTTTVNKVKDATIEKANQIEDAANKIKAAADAVDKVTK